MGVRFFNPGMGFVCGLLAFVSSCQGSPDGSLSSSTTSPISSVTTGDPAPAPVFTSPPTTTPTPKPSPSVTPSKSHQLSIVGLGLGAMSEAAYLVLQEKWVGSNEAACNFFVTTALCQDGQCGTSVPDVLAAEYGTYLESRGWKEIDLNTLEGLFLADANFDVIMQSDGTSSSSHGHVLIPVSLGNSHMLTVAQGELDTVTNQIAVENDLTLMSYDGGMHIWVSQ